MKRIPIVFFCLASLLACNKGTDVKEQKRYPNAVITACTIGGMTLKDNGTVAGIPQDAKTMVITFSRAIDIHDQGLPPGNPEDAPGCPYGIDGSMIPLFKEGPDSASITLILYDPQDPDGPGNGLKPFSKYKFTYKSGRFFGVNVVDDYEFNFVTAYDPSPKFPTVSDETLLDLVQQKTFSYFWDYAHPVSGLARERLGSGETVTIGGSGFGLMAILVGIKRGFITRSEGAARVLKIVEFLASAKSYHGAFPHWMNGSTGATIPFGDMDDGGDLVETAFLMEGLLACRQYFDLPSEAGLRAKISSLWKAVEWDWFQQDGQKVLYWHWSPGYGWKKNMQIKGWNEALIVYVLAASSPTHPISKAVYDEGWASNGGMSINYGSPMFFAHYSFMGLDPRNLRDAYGNYWEVNVRHAESNHDYCERNTKGWYGYSYDCWGLTASDYPKGYTASSPNNDTGTIAPTAALASMPYTPEESLAAMRHFFYILGDRLWGEYGFRDAFSLQDRWFASSYIAIDQGPIVVMLENYRSRLLWDTFMKDPDVQAGLTKLGFTYAGDLSAVPATGVEAHRSAPHIGDEAL